MTHKEECKAYYRKNKKLALRKRKKYYKDNKEKILKQMKEKYSSDQRYRRKVLKKMKEAYQDNPQKFIDKSSEQYKKKREEKLKAARVYRLARFFKLTPEEYTKIRVFQEKHTVFKLLLGKIGKKEAVEHRHKDGLIRGLMAVMLNRAYGIVEKLYPDNTSDVLRALALFHDNPPATSALGAPRYGIIGKARSKKKMRWGSENGPIKEERISARRKGK